MSFLLTALVQLGEEAEIVNVLVGTDLADVHVQLATPFHLDASLCAIQIFESKVFNAYVNLSKLFLLDNLDSARFRIILKKVFNTLSYQTKRKRSSLFRLLRQAHNALLFLLH
jgi:hypothetical protein